jgi:hypothetical protein
MHIDTAKDPEIRERTAGTELPDPVKEAAGELFGLPYLFPYQRLVVANILEAAEAAGAAVNWPERLRVVGLLTCAHDVPVLPRRGTDRHG